MEREIQRKRKHDGRPDRTTEQPHSQQAGSLKSLNGTELNELLWRKLQGGNEILSQEAPSLNPSLLQAIQNFLSLSGEKPTAEAAGAGENLSVKPTILNSLNRWKRKSKKKKT